MMDVLESMYLLAVPAVLVMAAVALIAKIVAGGRVATVRVDAAPATCCGGGSCADGPRSATESTER